MRSHRVIISAILVTGHLTLSKIPKVSFASVEDIKELISHICILMREV